MPRASTRARGDLLRGWTRAERVHRRHHVKIPQPRDHVRIDPARGRDGRDGLVWAAGDHAALDLVTIRAVRGDPGQGDETRARAGAELGRRGRIWNGERLGHGPEPQARVARLAFLLDVDEFAAR